MCPSNSIIIIICVYIIAYVFLFVKRNFQKIIKNLVFRKRAKVRVKWINWASCTKETGKRGEWYVKELKNSFFLEIYDICVCNMGKICYII